MKKTDLPISPLRWEKRAAPEKIKSSKIPRNPRKIKFWQMKKAVCGVMCL